MIRMCAGFALAHEPLPGMARVRQFLLDAVSRLPPDTGADSETFGIVVPHMLDIPARMHMVIR